MKMRNAGERFFTTFQILNGQRIRGSIGTIPDTTRVSNFNAPRRILRVKPKSPLSPGMIIQAPTGEKWAVAEYGRAFSGGVAYKAFKLYELFYEGSWTREQKIEDPVTGLQQPDVEQEIDTIWYTLEPAGQEEDTTNIPAQEYDLFTVSPLQLGDKVDGMKVIRAVDQTGITVARVLR